MTSNRLGLGCCLGLGCGGLLIATACGDEDSGPSSAEAAPSDAGAMPVQTIIVPPTPVRPSSPAPNTPPQQPINPPSTPDPATPVGTPTAPPFPTASPSVPASGGAAGGVGGDASGGGTAAGAAGLGAGGNGGSDAGGVIGGSGGAGGLAMAGFPALDAGVDAGSAIDAGVGDSDASVVDAGSAGFGFDGSTGGGGGSGGSGGNGGSGGQTGGGGSGGNAGEGGSGGSAGGAGGEGGNGGAGGSSSIDLDVGIVCDFPAAGAAANLAQMPFEFALVNNEPTAVDVRDLEIVYFYTPNTSQGAAFHVDANPYGATPVLSTEEIASGQGNATDYISVTFASSCTSACTIPPDGAAQQEIRFRVASEPNDGRYTLTDDFSYAAGTSNPCDSMVIRVGDVVVFGDLPAGLPANW